MDSFCPAHQEAVSSTDPDANLGEIIIKIPNEATHLMTEGRPLRIGIEFSLEQPAGGLHFVVPPGEGSLAEVFLNLYPNFASFHDCISFFCATFRGALTCSHTDGKTLRVFGFLASIPMQR